MGITKWIEFWVVLWKIKDSILMYNKRVWRLWGKDISVTYEGNSIMYSMRAEEKCGWYYCSKYNLNGMDIIEKKRGNMWEWLKRIKGDTDKLLKTWKNKKEIDGTVDWKYIRMTEKLGDMYQKRIENVDRFLKYRDILKYINNNWKRW